LRTERVDKVSPHLKWAPQIWMGVSIESAKYLQRIDNLRATGAHVKFLSLEPLLEPLHKMDLSGIDWAIVGGESGPGARPVDPAWVTDIRDQCLEAGVAFF
jgi:protein gp37